MTGSSPSPSPGRPVPPSPGPAGARRPGTRRADPAGGRRAARLVVLVALLLGGVGCSAIPPPAPPAGPSAAPVPSPAAPAPAAPAPVAPDSVAPDSIAPDSEPFGATRVPDTLSLDGTRAGQTTYQVDQTLREIDLDGVDGRITLLATTGPVHIAASVVYTDDRPRTDLRVVRGVLRLADGGCRRVRPTPGRCQVDWDISAPADTALDLHTRTGGIAVTGFSGPLTLRSDTGAVRGRALAAREVTARAGGSVDLRFALPPDQLDASAGAAGAVVRLPAGPDYALDLAGSGTPTVQVTDRPGSAHRVRVRSTGGPIAVTNG